jgi:ribosomal-protein-alanine N-acetyltransferase
MRLFELRRQGAVAFFKKPTKSKMEFKEYSQEYAESFAKIRNHPVVLNNGYDKTPNPFTTGDAMNFINGQLGMEPPQRFLIFEDGELAGEIGINIKEDVFRLNAEIGYFIAEKFWGRGIATAAIAKMTSYAFEKFNIIRIVAGVFEFNKASMSALEKNGYYLESTRKNAVIKNGKIMDDYIWVRLKEEHKAF